MTIVNFAIIAVILLILGVCTKLLGIHLCKILDYSKRPFMSSIIRPLEIYTYRILKIDYEKEHTWKDYVKNSMILLFLGIILFFCILSFQYYLPLNADKTGAPNPILGLNIAISFCTNTDWQSYSPEKVLSPFSQMAALTVQNFISPAFGIAISAALVRGLVRSSVHVLGNFWRDLIRVIYYLLLPLSILSAIFLVSEGVPQTFTELTKIKTLEGSTQTLYSGPIASQGAIKLIGTNGGGYTNADAAHPFENPTPLCNLVQIILILLVPFAQIYYFGRSTNSLKTTWIVFAMVCTVYILATAQGSIYEHRHPPLNTFLNIEPEQGNMEGKEVRIGSFGSAFYTVSSNFSSNGATNSSIDSYMPGGTFLAVASIILGETLLGGCGSGIFSFIMISTLSMYLIGLISGKDPEYLGKKIDVFNIKMSITTLMIYIVLTLGLTSLAVVSEWGISSKLNSGPRGFTELLYTFVSTASNNGSAMLTNSLNNPMYNITTGLAMLIHRMVIIIVSLFFARYISNKQASPNVINRFQVSGVTFCIICMTLVFILSGISFFPALFLGPIMESNDLYMGTLY